MAPIRLIRNPGDCLAALEDSGPVWAGVGLRSLVWERGHGADRRALARGGAGGALPRRAGRDRGAALPGDLAAGAGTDLPRSGRGAGLRAALGRGTGGPLQRAWPCGAGRPAATEWPGGEPADQRCAGRPGRAAADATRGRRAVERAEGRGLDGAPAWPGAGASAARLGRAAADRVVPSGAAPAASQGGNARAERGLQGGLDAAVAAARAAHPNRPVEVWAEDEHRLGLKPIRRRVWAPVG